MIKPSSKSVKCIFVRRCTDLKVYRQENPINGRLIISKMSFFIRIQLPRVTLKIYPMNIHFTALESIFDDFYFEIDLIQGKETKP
ncbi:hypothetical protein BKA69DRAFT_1101876 [Paraphysoderma sedebokerense]|nr:hypothetical protein BKA69DRAFT_1101876 [Paraphysoderma sedebokerense]